MTAYKAIAANVRAGYITKGQALMILGHLGVTWGEAIRRLGRELVDEKPNSKGPADA